MSADSTVEILNEDQIRRAITRIAHEISERNQGSREVVLIGILNRGDVLAERIAGQIGKIENFTPPVGALDITFHRDDFSRRSPSPEGPGTSHIPFSLENKRVVLVDDVLYTGRSIRAAMDELLDYGRPCLIQLAVLIDRGHRELPIHADFIGKSVPTSRREEIAVALRERDGRDGVFIENPDRKNIRTGAADHDA